MAADTSWVGEDQREEPARQCTFREKDTEYSRTPLRTLAWLPDGLRRQLGGRTANINAWSSVTAAQATASVGATAGIRSAKLPFTDLLLKNFGGQAWATVASIRCRTWDLMMRDRSPHG